MYEHDEGWLLVCCILIDEGVNRVVLDQPVHRGQLVDNLRLRCNNLIGQLVREKPPLSSLFLSLAFVKPDQAGAA